MAETGQVSVETVDKSGQPITIFSTSGKPRSEADFVKALEQYDKTNTTGEGFVALPPGAMSDIRNRLATVSQAAGAVGEAVGGFVGTSPLMLLAAKAGLISPQAATAPISAGRDVGRYTGEAAGAQVATPGRAGATAATALTSPLMAPVSVAKAAGPPTLSLAATLGNAVKSGIAGAAGYLTGEAATGRMPSPAETAEEFIVAALGGGFSSLVGHWITKYAVGNTGEKVAKSIIDELIKDNPALANTPNALDIAVKGSPRRLTAIVQKMSQSLVGGVENATDKTVQSVINSLPSALSKSQRTTVTREIRQLAKSANQAFIKALDNLDNPEAYEKSIEATKEPVTKLVNYIKTNFPTAKSATNIGNVLVNEYSSHIEGARVLHAMKQAGTQNGWDAMKFAQAIKGNYLSGEEGSLMQRVGQALRPGGQLTDIPDEAARSSKLVTAYNYLKDQIAPPFLSPMLTIRGGRAPQVPWQSPQSLIPLRQADAAQTGLLDATRRAGLSASFGGLTQAAGRVPAQQYLDATEKGDSAMREYLKRLTK